MGQIQISLQKSKNIQISLQNAITLIYVQISLQNAITLIKNVLWSRHSEPTRLNISCVSSK